MTGYFFFLQLALGLLLFLYPVPLKMTGKGFGKLIGFIALAALLFATLLRARLDLVREGPLSASFWATAAALLCAFIHVGLLSERHRLRNAVGHLLACAGSLAALVTAVWPLDPFGATLGNALCSALLLGAITDAMVLGHWYIVLPRMALAPLLRLTAAVLALLVLRAGGIALFGHPVWPVALAAHPENLRPALFTIQRILFGIIVPFVFAILVLKTARIRSTQSATGILYVTNVFVFVGELTAAHMTYALHRIC